MPAKSTRLLLPLGDFIGARGDGTIKTIQAGCFAAVDANFPNAVSEMVVSIDNNTVFVDNETVTL